ncbi:MAG TPA: hypothetical protein VGN76_12285 [Gemmatimonadales bacterium]|nr:hypothetical protein [Gemmatimonadales bacterium]
MICRIWHGWTTPENADAYDSLLRKEIFQGNSARKIAGYLGIDLLRRDLDGSHESSPAKARTASSDSSHMTVINFSVGPSSLVHTERRP